MHMLTIPFGQGAWTFLYKTEEKAVRDYNQLGNSAGMAVEIEDDFGQKLRINEPHKLFGALVEDLELSKMGAIEKALHAARTQARGDQLASADPILQNLHRMRGNTPMITPFPNNGRGS
jgi:hypothetical protein